MVVSQCSKTWFVKVKIVTTNQIAAFHMYVSSIAYIESKANFGKFGIIKNSQKGQFCVQELVTLNTLLPKLMWYFKSY